VRERASKLSCVGFGERAYKNYIIHTS